MLKAKTQKIILAIPLRPEIAIWFSVILGVLGLFLPWVYLFVQVQDPSGLTTSMIIPQTKFIALLELNDCAAIYNSTKWLVVPPKWLGQSMWNDVTRIFWPVLVNRYFWKFHSERYKTVSRVILVFLIVGIIALVSFVPGTEACDPALQLAVYGYSILWFSISVPVIRVCMQNIE